MEEWGGFSLSHWYHPRGKAENPGGQGHVGKTWNPVNAFSLSSENGVVSVSLGF